ncbi:MAG: sigma 54-interacting transcriptional regulator [Deltaproteobacteria bacterium]|nr:sigma 54-interacting transcriptional regulator [Deltaproteobacteria bacterium]
MIRGFPTNRRQTYRFPFRLPFTLSFGENIREYAATSIDLNHLGAQISTNAALYPGMELQLRPESLSDNIENSATGEVKWMQAGPHVNRYGIAFQQEVKWLVSLDKATLSVPNINQYDEHTVSEFVLNSINDGVFSVDRTWRITSFNKAAEKLTGWARHEVIGMPCREIFRSSACDNCVLAESIKNGKPIVNRSLFITTAKGKRIPVNISATPLKDPDGKVVGGVQVFRNVSTVQGRALILDSIADGVFTVNRRWEITSFNRAAEEITGVPASEAIGKPCSDIFQASICGETCAIAHSMCTGKPESNRSITIRGPEGRRVPVSICAAPLVDSEGNIVGGVESIRDLSIITSLRQRLSRFQVGDIISKSPSVRRIFDILPEIARSDSNILILGESGTGKELLAKAIHQKSDRHNHPFIAVNCGALPDTLLESELFGYKAGAFTDAKKDRPGRFAAAEKGTLFLDEIGDINPGVQVKLLRVIQSRQYEPLGSSTPVDADVRIIAATNRDLLTLMQEGVFRDDLYDRLNVVKLQLPPLRERREDIPVLVEHIVEKFNKERGKDIGGISDAAMALLMSHDFPGNVRELQNIIEYAFILCQGGMIQPEQLPEPFRPKSEGTTRATVRMDRPMSMEEAERFIIHQALQRNKWKKLATCRELQISKDTLRRKICQFKIEEPSEEMLVEQ